MATKKHVKKGPARPPANPSGERPRPRITASHEKPQAGAGARARSAGDKPRIKVAREAPRAGGALARDRAQGLRKAKPADEPSGPPRERTGWGSIASEAARETARAIAMAALDKKAVGLEILDVAGRVDYADFLVIMTGRSDRHTNALAQGIEEALKKDGLRPLAVEGLSHGSWVLMDFGDVVVHVFQDEARQLYDLEGLWLDARRLPVPAPTDAT